MIYPILTPEEAARLVKNGDNIGFSGFTFAGIPKVVPGAIAQLAEEEHAAGREYKVNLFTGASTNNDVDGALARAHALNQRTPYQSTKEFRPFINEHSVHYFDLHLSELAQKFRYGTYGPMNVAIIEAQSISDEGEIILSTGTGNAPTWTQLADKIIVEINDQLPAEIRGMHDIYVPLDPPCRREIPIYHANDRIGTPGLWVDPKKVAGVVYTSKKLGGGSFTPTDETTMKIGANVCGFLVNELKKGRLPKSFLPIQSGVGNVANAVLNGLNASKEIPPFMMYTEVMQDTVLDLIESGKCQFASTSSMTVSQDAYLRIISNMHLFHDKIALRPSELSNNPEIIRRLGVIAMNTALEADIFGHINSTHVSGTKMMNGIGGSGDFTRNGYISIFSCPSEAKGGCISAIVPMVSHCDHTEHSVDVIITEQGVADIRGLDPVQRAKVIIDNCAHPDYRPLLHEYLNMGKGGQTPHTLAKAFSFHTALAQEGDMRKCTF